MTAGGWWHDPNDGSCQWLERTQHYLCGGFSSYYWNMGRGPVFGGPISEEWYDANSGAQSRQDFENGHMLWFPGSDPPHWDVRWVANS